MPSNKVTWIEGETQASNIINALADEIVAATMPDGALNKWEKVLVSKSDKWVTYQKKTRPSVQGMYKHTDGKSYPVYKLRDNTALKISGYGVPLTELVDAAGFVYEVTRESPSTQTGKKFQVRDLTLSTGKIIELPGALVTLVDDPNNVEFQKQAWFVEQKKVPFGETGAVPDPEWNEFILVEKMPDDWTYLLVKKSVPAFYKRSDSFSTEATLTAGDEYKFTETYYVADVTNTANDIVVLKTTPDVPQGVAATDYYVMLQHPIDQYNYFDVYQGEGFSGTPASGNSRSTYDGIVDLTTVKQGVTPTIIDQKKAEKQYLKQIGTTPAEPDTFIPPVIQWRMDGNIPVVSPPAHFFFGADSTVPWVTNKKRRPDYWVGYWISLSNSRAALVIEGDPAPDMEAYYRSFGYIGKIVPFANYDHAGNFGVTVGMGEPTVNRSGFTVDNIKPERNPIYAGYGRYTSNGMTSVSMLRTRSSVMFQAYYPAFITQLPNYKGVGTLPEELSTLVLEKNGFQASSWTDKYHASPVYLVHQYEGYRGYMDGVVAINDHNLINLDELVVDTEELKDPADLSKGTWTEVYKFFSVKSPVSFLKYSANPDECSIAILKEIK